jgi:pyruvate/2-oxoglutarate dehydrogenase complex dihydrolipoamide dehydrogenase (E3) component
VSERREVDVVVVGSGPSGEVIAGRLADRDLEVVIVEDRLVAGECSYWACMPSKALLRPAQAVQEARRVPGAAQAVDGAIDVAAVLARRDEIIHNLDDSGQLPWLEDRGIGLVRGHGRLAGERTVRVGDEIELVARRAVVVAVGTAPMIPPVPGLAEARPWTNREATTTKVLPGSLLVLGGGVVGVELAQAFATLGVTVTLVEREGRILERDEAFAADLVAEGLKAAGVTILCDVKATSVARGDDGRVTMETEGGTGTLTADEILVASGRRQVTDALGLETIGLEAGSPPKPIAVGTDLRVPGHDWLYVIGDANGRELLTHEGKYQARVAADVICGRDVRIRDQMPPRVTFTEPQIAAVGHTLDSARKAGIDAREVDVPTQSTAGASFHGKGTDGTSRIVVDEARHVIVGATFVGSDVAEWLHAATIAIVGEVPLDDLYHAVPAFPTRSEVWLNLLNAYGS